MLYIHQGDRPIPEERVERIAELIEPWFCFSLVWTLGGTCDGDGRRKFDKWLREKMKENNVSDNWGSSASVSQIACQRLYQVY